MPHTLPYRPLLIDELISTDRIASYQNVFQPTNDMELLGVYLWSHHVGGVFQPVLSALEVALRNAIDRELTQMLGMFWWKAGVLKSVDELAGLPIPDPQNNIRNGFKTATRQYLKEAKKLLPANTNITPAPTHQGVLAKTEFSIWDNILDHQFMDRALIWPSALGRVFRGPWPDKKAHKTLSAAKDLAQTIRLFRNRLAHHEPIWKRYGVQNEADAITHLHERLGTMEKLLLLIHPEYHRMLIVNGQIPNAYRAASSSEIRRFQHQADVRKIRTINHLVEVVQDCHLGDEIIIASPHCGGRRRVLITPLG